MLEQYESIFENLETTSDLTGEIGDSCYIETMNELKEIANIEKLVKKDINRLRNITNRAHENCRSFERTTECQHDRIIEATSYIETKHNVNAYKDTFAGFSYSSVFGNIEKERNDTGNIGNRYYFQTMLDLKKLVDIEDFTTKDNDKLGNIAETAYENRMCYNELTKKQHSHIVEAMKYIAAKNDVYI